MYLDKQTAVGVIGAGTMGRGIAQIAAAYGHQVVLVESNPAIREDAEQFLQRILKRMEEKEKIGRGEANAILERIDFQSELSACEGAGLIIEAIFEDLPTKHKVFRELESIAGSRAILASNTSSLSITAIAGVCRLPERVLGAHFFNPAPLMPLVEIVPGLATSKQTIQLARNLINDWGKTTVLAKDTPGFIVNRVARPFYGEALRILEEGIADVATIDWAMKKIGGFRMGPFELMDLIGNDVNYKVTETVFEAFFYDPRYRPSFTQKRMVEAGRLGKKTEIGYYDYSFGAKNPEPVKDPELGQTVFTRILAMLINEAADAVFMNIASIEDVDMAMTKGVNYPKGLLAWADEMGLDKILGVLENLQSEYGEDRYRPCPLLKRMVRQGQTFYPPSN